MPAKAYGLLFAIGIIGIMFTNVINARVVTRFGSDKLLGFGSYVAALAGISLAVAARTGMCGLYGLLVPLFVFCSATGFVVANSIAGALSGFPERAGAVSALIGALQYGSGIVGSALVGAFAEGTPSRPSRLY